jgi:hypothetical protein
VAEEAEPANAPPPPALMVIFSLGGLTLATHRRSAAVRCRTAFVPVPSPSGEPPRVVLAPYPDEGLQGIVEGGRARVVRGDDEVGSRALDELGGGARRWDDLDVLIFAATSLWAWVALPLAVAARLEPGRSVTVTAEPDWPVLSPAHVLVADEAGRVVRHEEGGSVHRLSGHCDFGGVTVATHRRTLAHGVAVLWGDVVAAAVHGRP